jgi:hypothetical protein
MSNTRIILVLFILSEIPAAWYAAQAAWRRPSAKTNKRTIMGMIVGIALTIYGLGRLVAIFTNLKFGRHLSACLTEELETRSLIQGATQALAIWIFAFAFTADDRPSWPRRQVNALMGKLQ